MNQTPEQLARAAYVRADKHHLACVARFNSMAPDAQNYKQARQEMQHAATQCYDSWTTWTDLIDVMIEHMVEYRERA